ncbi:MAG: vitamin K epoxide reductase family protein [Candidatus Gastranaerophilales bacterium]
MKQLNEIQKKKTLILILTIIGLITTIKLAIIYFQANFNPFALSSFCSVNEFIDCDGVAKTNESQFLGVPLALWGILLYVFMFLMLFVDKLKNYKLLKFLEVFKNPLAYLASLGLISFSISMILLCVSLFEIKKLCILCAATYIINLIIGLVATDFKNGGFIASIKQSYTDLVDALNIKKYAIAFASVVIAACCLLGYTNATHVLAPQVKRSAGISEFVNAKTNKYIVTGNILGDKNGAVKVYVFSDYQCPICKAHNIMMHKLAKELKNVEIVHKNLPLDMECNSYLINPFHEGSCTAARYALAAEEQGRFWDINSILFEKKPKTEAEILEIAAELDFDIEKLIDDADSIEVSNRLRKEIDFANQNGINGTPTIVLNRKIIVGIKPYDEFKALLIKAGARNR